MGIIPETAVEGPGRRPIPAPLRLLVCRRIREGGWPVWKATRYYHVKRQSVYRWLSRYGGTPESLASRSRRPKRSPRSIPREAARRIASLWRKYKGIGWSSCDVYARMLGLGHSVSYSTVLRYLKKADGYAPYRTNPPARAPRKYHTPEYPGEKWQMDVKFVPSECKAPTLPADKGYYQYTVIDEASRKRFLYFCDEHSMSNSIAALAGAVAFFGYPPKVVQTDNGTEFCRQAPRDSGEPSAFGLCLARLGADHKRIRPGTPRHNGKVERSHRIDQEKFYRTLSFHSLADLREQGKRWMKRYNSAPKAVLGFRSPDQAELDGLSRLLHDTGEARCPRRLTCLDS